MRHHCLYLYSVKRNQIIRVVSRLKIICDGSFGYNPYLIMPLYNFNPWEGADHNRRRYLGTPGLNTDIIGTEREDPKYSGPCGPEYSAYRTCLKLK